MTFSNILCLHFWPYSDRDKLIIIGYVFIFQSVITNKYVVDMVRQTIEKGNFTDNPFEPKFTRAKKK